MLLMLFWKQKYNYSHHSDTLKPQSFCRVEVLLRKHSVYFLFSKLFVFVLIQILWFEKQVPVA